MRAFPLTTSLALIAFASGSADAGRDQAPSNPEGTLGIEWEEVAGNPLLIPGPCLSWRCAGVSDPTIARAADGRLKIWFAAMGLRLGWTGLKAVGPVVGLASAEALLEKVDVSPESAIIDVGRDGEWDRYVETPTVRQSDTGLGWTMWYAGYAARGDAANPFIGIALGQSHSADREGKIWKRSATPIYRAMPGAWDERLVSGPTVLRGPDGMWRLYYSGAGTKQGVGLLTSSDGEHWVPYAGNPVLEPQPGAWDEQILEQATAYVGGRYWLWYSAYRNPLGPTTSIAIGVATSEDGIHWTKHRGNPVITPGPPGAWNDLRVLAPDVIEEPDGSLLMVAYGSSHKDIGRQAGFIGFWRSRK
jgi:hypothetical protein